jgi:hypothetical protein
MGNMRSRCAGGAKRESGVSPLLTNSRYAVSDKGEDMPTDGTALEKPKGRSKPKAPARLMSGSVAL